MGTGGWHGPGGTTRPVRNVQAEGIFTEVLDDVSFQIALLSERDASAMMDSIRGPPILGPVCGAAPADRSALSRILIGVGRIGLERRDRCD